MHIRTLAGCAVLCVSILASGAAMAQSVDQWSGKTCADFTAMDASAQNDFIAAHLASTADNTLATQAGSVNKDAAAANSTASSDATTDTTKAVPGTDAEGSYTAGQLIAACQAATPTSTLQDALSRSMTKSDDSTTK